ncbi:MAG: hypothetical protein J2P16_00540 [Mycobacterium sp.]|nr:hypothetical protein [Mycobacterium sp.]
MKIVTGPTSYAETAMCVQADGRTPVPKGDLADNEVLGLALEAGNGI